VSALGVLQSVQFVIGTDGHPTAVQIDIKTWNLLLDWLEDNEDRALVKAAIPKLRSGPEKAGALRWEEIRAEWDTLESRAQR
jgi:hypothetical protein